MLADIGSRPGARRFRRPIVWFAGCFLDHRQIPKSGFAYNADSVRKIIIIYPMAGLDPAIYE
jgi:hypothetical protein